MIFNQDAGAMLFYYLNLTPTITASGEGGAIDDNTTFDNRVKYDPISENQYLIPHASAHANQNKDYVELVVSLPNIEQGGFNSGNNEVEDITNYVATSYSFKHSRLCLEILDEIIIS